MTWIVSRTSPPVQISRKRPRDESDYEGDKRENKLELVSPSSKRRKYCFDPRTSQQLSLVPLIQTSKGKDIAVINTRNVVEPLADYAHIRFMCQDEPIVPDPFAYFLQRHSFVCKVPVP